MNRAVRPAFLLAFILAVLSSSCGERGGGPGSQGPCARVVPVRRGDLSQRITARGTVKPVSLVQVKPGVEGTVTEVLVRVGDKVRKGQAVARVALDAKYQSYITESRLMLISARQKRQALEKQIERSRQLAKDGLMAQTAVEEQEAGLEEIRLRERIAQERVVEIEGKLGRKLEEADTPPPTEILIRAPIEGTVVEVAAQGGETITPAQQGTGLLRDRAFLALADLSRQVLVAGVSELDVNRLSVGQGASVQFDSLPDQQLAGKISRIAVLASPGNSGIPDPSGNGGGGRKRFDVEIALDPGAPPLRTGLSFRASFLTEERKGVLLIPIAAVIPEGKRDVVMVRKGEGFIRVPIVTGMADEDRVEVVTGVAEGDLVCERPAPIPPPPQEGETGREGDSPQGQGPR